MILETIINILFLPLQALLSLLPDISWNVENNFLNSILDIFQVVCYLLPMKTVVAILTIIIAINVFKIVISIIKTIWQLIPLL